MSIKKTIHDIHEKIRDDDEYIFNALEQIRGCLDQPIQGCVDTESTNLTVEEAEAIRRIYVESRNN